VSSYINALPTYESNDHPSYPQEYKILEEENHETNAISVDTSDEEIELGFEGVFSSCEDNQESALFNEHSLSMNNHYWEFLGSPVYDTSDDGSVFSDVLDQHSLAEEVDINQEVFTHLLKDQNESCPFKDIVDCSHNIHDDSRFQSQNPFLHVQIIKEELTIQTMGHKASPMLGHFQPCSQNIDFYFDLGTLKHYQFQDHVLIEER